MFKESTLSNRNAIHNTNKVRNELFHHHDSSYRYSTLIHAKGVTRDVACLFLLLWLCLIAHVQGVAVENFQFDETCLKKGHVTLLPWGDRLVDCVSGGPYRFKASRAVALVPPCSNRSVAPKIAVAADPAS